MTGISIVCAYADLGDTDRQRAYEFTRSYWRHHFPDAELVSACPEPFTRAAGLNAAVKAAAHDLIVQADPDTITPAGQIRRAIQLAIDSDGLIAPFSDYLYLNRDATARLHACSLDSLPAFTEDECQFSGYGGCGPVTVYTRATWEKARGYDERFGIWGGDDSAFMYACEAFTDVPLRRVFGPALHSFHERLPQSDPKTYEYREQFALLSPYRDAAAASRQHVRQLVLTRR